MKKTTEVFVREKNKFLEIEITDEDKPVVEKDIMERWQAILDLIPSILEVDAALIIKISSEKMHILLKSNNLENPYLKGGYDNLGNGFYCESTMGLGKKLIVVDALKSDIWKHNPEIKLGMISYIGYPIKWPDGKVFGTICIINKNPIKIDEKIEILEKYKDTLEKDLNFLVYKAEFSNLLIKNKQLNEYKSLVFPKIGHEIMTPLNAIMGLSDLNIQLINELELQNKQQQKEHKNEIINNAKNIKNMGEFLTSTITDVLEMASLNQNKISIYSKPCDMQDVYNKILYIIKYRTDLKKQKFKFIQNDNTVRYQNIDKKRFSRILVNILGNASKYTYSKGEISWKIDSKKENNKIYEVHTISDTGIGINEKYLDRVFEPFFQEANDLLKIEGGTGVGLSIAKNYIELLGGNIEIKSKKGEGTTVEIKYPVNKIYKKDYESCIQKKVLRDMKNLKEKTVLIVEDNDINIKILKLMLENKGINVLVAKNGKEAIDIVEVTPIKINAIIMDIEMPIINGKEATQKIRKFRNKELSEIPIIGLSTYTSKEEILSCIKVGMNTYLSKPIKIEELFESLLEFCN